MADVKKIENFIEVECSNLNLHYSNNGKDGNPVVNRTGLKVQIFLNKDPVFCKEEEPLPDRTILNCDLYRKMDGSCEYSNRQCLQRMLTKSD